MRLLTSALFVLLISTSSFAQESQYKILSYGFYNLENLFDTQNDTTINDEDFLPEGKNKWTDEKYNEKLANMAFVISKIGIEDVPTGLSVLGVSEVENRKVLEDLVNQSAIKDRNYQIVHHESPDWRGIDVALLYNPNHFTPVEKKTFEVPIFNSDGERRYTRDVLMVKGLLDSDTITFLVNHWPSRSGGEKRSAPRRIKAASVVKGVVDSLLAVNPNAKISIMGDLNDDPTSTSVKKYLKTKTRLKKLKEGDIYNAFNDFYRRGLGSNAYRDNWSLFDQIMITKSLAMGSEGYTFYKARIFNKKFLIQKSGKYRGYPFRTFSGNTYQGGYSDHFPVYMYLIKEI